MTDWKQEIREWLRDLKLSPVREAEIVDELALHVEERYNELLADGLPEQQASELALAEMRNGDFLRQGLEQVERSVRDEFVQVENGRRYRSVNLWPDIRLAIRVLRKNRGFSTIVILTLALCIGANTAIFSVINGVLLKPLPFKDPDRLVMIWTDNPAYQLGFHEFPAANADLPEWRASATSFDMLGAFQPTPADLSDDGNPERVGRVDISANLLPLLGFQPLLGRQFRTEEEQPGQDRVTIIGYGLWQRRFGGDPNVVGKIITVNRVPCVIVGVMPEAFNFPQATEMPRAYNLPERADLWMPLAKDANYWQNRAQRQLVMIVGRLKPTVTMEQAQTEMDAIAARQARDYPQTHEGWRVWLTPLFSQIVGQTRTPLLVLLGAVAFLLFIGCANIASLLLARATIRRREMVLRAAIGAGRGRIIRQLLTESSMLALLGGTCGLLFGYFGLNLLLRFIPSNVPRLQEVSLDFHVFLFTALISIFTGVLFGLLPAWQASKVNLAEALKDAARSNSSGRGLRGHSLIVTAEVAVLVVLLLGAVLMLQSFRHLLAVDPGFNAEGVATFELSLPANQYSHGPQREQFFEQVQTQLSNLPGVTAVGAVSNLPLSGNESLNYFFAEGSQPVPRGKEPLAEDRVITPGYFQAMGVSRLSGRDFEAMDSAHKRNVAIINETLARQFFSGGDAVGKRIKWVLGDEDWSTIVGVVRDVRGFSLEVQPRPQVYHPMAQESWTDAMTIVVRANESVLPQLRTAIQQELKKLDSTIPIAHFRMMPDLVDRAMARARFNTLLLGLFAAMALLLTVIGLYGVVAYGVSQRTREIGIRVALGAQRQNVLALVIREGMRPALIGVGIGLVGAIALMRFLASQLYEVRPTEPVTYGLVALGLLVVSLMACYFPARRATRVDPLEALRSE